MKSFTGKMPVNFLVCFFSILSFMGATAAMTADNGYEQPGEYKASALLKPEMVQGKYHKVDQRVLHDGFLYHFMVQSSFGPFEVTSPRPWPC